MEEMPNIQSQPSIIRSFQQGSKNFNLISPITLIASIVIILSGVATGFLLSRGKQVISTAPSESNSSQIKKGQIFGSEDTKTFRDMAEGTLEKGGVFEEGSHKLIRPGGESQTAALTSSIINLDQFVSRKVKVWGETQQAKKAGWLMDVGRLEVLE